MQLWTDKYKPIKAAEIVGQKNAAEETAGFLDHWKPGKALLFHGPPGVGKTLIAEVAAAERGWALVQINASDSRTGRELEELLSQSSRQMTLFHVGKLILIDEADGISGRERGAAAAIAKVIKESRFPVILIANDPWLPKLRPLRAYCTMVKFGIVPYPSIAKRLREIAGREKIRVDDEVLKNLARWASGDIRSAILDLQMLSAGKEEITEKDLESLGFREREKGMFDIMPTLFFSGNLNAARRAVREGDKDPDDIFWWLEGNLQVAYKNRDSLAGAYELLAKADMFRSLVIRQQNWRFKAYMIDLMSGVSLFRDERHGFTPFRPPDRLVLMGQTSQKRALAQSISGKLGGSLHCSGRVIKREYIPFMKYMMKRGAKVHEEFGLTPDEIEAIRKY